MLQYVLSTILYGIGLVLGFFAVGFIVPSRQLVNEKEETALEELLHFPYLYIEELEKQPDTDMTEDELLALKDKTIEMDIPFLSKKVIMFYDHECETFKYYSNSDTIYKHLNVVCRKYVLENQCKKIYKFDTISTLTMHDTKENTGPFIQKTERSTLDKNTNKFLRIGTIEEFGKSLELKPVVNISFMDFVKIKNNSEPKEAIEAKEE